MIQSIECRINESEREWDGMFNVQKFIQSTEIRPSQMLKNGKSLEMIVSVALLGLGSHATMHTPINKIWLWNFAIT